MFLPKVLTSSSTLPFNNPSSTSVVGIKYLTMCLEISKDFGQNKNYYFGNFQLLFSEELLNIPIF